jgi:LysM repeat protein
MDARLRNRVVALLVLGATALLGFAACGAPSSGGSASGVTTSTPASTSFRTIPVTSTTSTTLGPAAADKSSSDNLPAGDYYTVKSNDVWVNVAKKLGVPLDALLQANGATEQTPLYVGHKIRLPSADPGSTAAPGGAAAPGTTVAGAPPDSAAVSADGYQLYTVQFGDAWISIAKKFKVDWKALMQLNGVDPVLTSKAPLPAQVKIPKA